MQKYQNSIQDVHGNAVASATVTVYLYGTLTPATIYSDNGLTVIPSSQVTTDSDGQFYFYADNGRYTLSVVATGFAQEQFSDVSLFDQADAGIASVKDYGAVGDGATDDTAAIQAAITNSYGKKLEFPPGTYKISSTINISSGISLVGAGRALVTITWASTSLEAFSVTTNTQVVFDGLTFYGPASPVAGSVISLTGGSGSNSFSRISNCQFNRVYIAVDTVSAYAWTIENCYFYNFVLYGVRVRNNATPDTGDSSIINCIFAGPLGGSNTCVYQQSSGGLRVVGNKMNTGQYGYRWNADNSLSSGTSDLIISANSIENASIAGINLTALTGAYSNTLTNIAITGNQIALCPISVLINPNYTAFGHGTISSNSFSLPAGGTYGIDVGYFSNLIVGDNAFYAASGTPTAINVRSNVSGAVSTNSYLQGISWAAKVANASGSMYVARPSVAAGTATPGSTGWSSSGGLYYKGGSVTFGAAFDSAPAVTVNPNTLQSGVSVAVYNVTTTGFTYVAWSTASAPTGDISYSAFGVR